MDPAELESLENEAEAMDASEFVDTNIDDDIPF